MAKPILIPVVESMNNAQLKVDLPSVDVIADTFERLTIPEDKSLDLKVVMTQACNLTCHYCPQQKTEPLISWTDESLGALFEGFLRAHPGEDKAWRWFGGEPMLYHKIIRRFMNKYRKQIEETPNLTIEMTTNGTLLTEDFIEMFLGFQNAILVVSLDTVFSANDWRHLESDQLRKIITALKLIAKQHGPYNTRITMSTVPEHIPLLMLNLQLLYQLGVRDFYMNTILFDHTTSEYLDWNPDNLAKVEEIVDTFCSQRKDACVIFAGETKRKDVRESNCMAGRKGLNIDGSGDITGCAIFNTDKKRYNGNDTVFANVFTGLVTDDLTDRFNEQNNLYESDPRCSTCDIEGLCSMCPMSHVTVTQGATYFASTPYCQDIVRTHIKTRNISEDNLKFRQKIIAEYEQRNTVDKKSISGPDTGSIERG